MQHTTLYDICDMLDENETGSGRMGVHLELHCQTPIDETKKEQFQKIKNFPNNVKEHHECFTNVISGKINKENQAHIEYCIVNGRSLKQYLEDSPPAFSPEKIYEIVLNILEVLETAHQSDMIHGSLNLENVWVLDFTGKVSIRDFGLYHWCTGMLPTVQDDLCAVAKLFRALLLWGDSSQKSNKNYIPEQWREFFNQTYLGKFHSAEEMHQALEYSQKQGNHVAPPKPNFCNYPEDKIRNLLTYAENMMQRYRDFVREYGVPYVDEKYKPFAHETGLYPSRREYERLLSDQFYLILKLQGKTELTDWTLLNSGAFGSAFYVNRDGNRRAVKIFGLFKIIEWIEKIRKLPKETELDAQTILDIADYIRFECQTEKIDRRAGNIAFCLRSSYRRTIFQIKREIEVYLWCMESPHTMTATFYPEYSTPLSEIKEEVARLADIEYYPDSQNSLKYAVLEMEFGLSYSCYEQWLVQSDNYAGYVLPALRDLFESVASVHPYVVHFDLKPANMLLVWRNGKLKPVMIDFNASHIDYEQEDRRDSENVIRIESDLTNFVGFFAHTEKYGAPETHRISKNHQLKTSKIDVFALGVMAYELICGLKLPSIQYPFQEDDFKFQPIFESFSLSDENKRNLLLFLKSCIKEKPEQRPDARTASEKLSKFCLEDKKDMHENELELIRPIVTEIIKGVTHHTLTDGTIKRYQPFQSEMLCYPDESELMYLASKQLLWKQEKSLNQNHFIVSDNRTAYRYCTAVVKDLLGKQHKTHILQQIYIPKDGEIDQTCRELMEEVENFRQYKDMCPNIAEIYPSFCILPDENGALPTIDIGGKKIPFIAVGREFGLSYVNYMKWLFQHPNYSKRVLEAVQSLLFMMKDFHDSGFVHEDIRPEKILLVQRRNNCKPVLTGTFRPERTEETQTIRQDIYQMGHIIYELFDQTLDCRNVDYNRKPKYVTENAKFFERLGFVSKDNPVINLIEICLNTTVYPKVSDNALIRQLYEAIDN